MQKLDQLLARTGVKAKVSAQGGITFDGWSEQDRVGVTDACAYRRIMATGSVTAKMAIARAEALAGRGVNKQSVAQGLHSHDGGTTWHKGH